VACKPTDSMVFNANEEWDDYQCGDFSPGRYAWEANSFKTYVNPIPYRGAQGLFNVPDDILPRLAA
jgi:hypothetical protein